MAERRNVCRPVGDPRPVLGDSDMGNRQLTFLGDEQCARLSAIIAERDPDGLFVGCLAHDRGALNRNHWE